MGPTITTHDIIATQLAHELGFNCRKNQNKTTSTWHPDLPPYITTYTWTLPDNDPRHNITSPYTPSHTTQNPCHEIPLNYTIHIKIHNNTLAIDHNPGINYDLNDPQLIEKLKQEFKDLKKLQEKLDNLQLAYSYKEAMNLNTIIKINQK